MLKEKSLAPDFTLPDQVGINHKLSAYLGKWVLLYFYPKDSTPGCTKEACTIKDEWAGFKKNKIVVLGVSADTVKSHLKFVEKYSLPFTLLADVDKKVVKKYKAYGKKKFMGVEYEGVFRVSYLIDPQGKIAKVYKDVKPDLHALEILSDYKILAKK